MVRNLGIAALLALAFAMPAYEAAAQDALGGAILGGAAGAIFGGAVGGGRGAAIGAVIGAGTGAAIASEGERRRGGYYAYHDGCYIQRGDGAWVRPSPLLLLALDRFEDPEQESVPIPIVEGRNRCRMHGGAPGWCPKRET